MKQCPKCFRTYDDSQSFCLMDGTPLIIENEETIVRQQAPAPGKKGILLWLGLLGLILLAGFVLIAGFLIYKFTRPVDYEQAKQSRNVNGSPSPTFSPAPKATPEPANPSPVEDSSPETDKSPAGNTDSEDVTSIDWDTTAIAFKNDAGRIYKFQCPPDGTPYTIWGSDVYTQDSSICTAAVHAGVFSLADGGEVTLEFRPGRPTYGSTLRNGIKSTTFGEYAHSFVVR
jgi:hypothetical protein